ncbi:MAG: hypothetical protein V1651_03475 [Patescibacteria group bacterium]
MLSISIFGLPLVVGLVPPSPVKMANHSFTLGSSFIRLVASSSEINFSSEEVDCCSEKITFFS